MRNTLTLFVLLLTVTTAVGQITLTNEYFPTLGDTLSYGVADSTFTVDLLTPGADRQWDFGRQQPVSAIVQVVREANDAVFTEADLAVDIDAENVGYYSVGETAYELVGIRGSNELFPGILFDAPVAPARAQRRAPLNFGDSFSGVTTNVIIVPRDSIPDDVVEQFGATIAEVDSVRITTVSDRSDEVDAYGTLTLNGKTYDVLRERRTETINTTVEVQSGLLGYIDITSSIAPFVPDLANFVGQQDPTVTYYYWTDTEKEAVAIVTTEEDGTLTRMSFISGDATNSTRGPQLARAQVNVYPNPARGRTTFEVRGIDPGTYTLRVINVLGRQVSQQRFTPVGNTTSVPIDVSGLPRGTYLYSLTNERGLILTTRRLLVGN